MAPGGVDLGPVNWLVRQAAKAEAIDGSKSAIVTDAEGVVINITALQFL